MLKRLLIYGILFCLSSVALAKILFISTRDGTIDIYLMNDDGSNVQRLTFTENPQQAYGSPAWSPDGSRIVYTKDTYVAKVKTNQKYDIYLMDSDGSNVEQLTDDRALDGACSWSPDGNHIVFHSNRDEGLEIYVMDIITREVDQLTNIPGELDSATAPSWSPNGKYIAYEHAVNAGFMGAGNTIYVMKANGSSAKALVPIAKDWTRRRPHWSPDSKSILYRESRYAVVDQITKLVATNLVIQRHGSNVRQILKIPKSWLVNSVEWMDDGKQVLFSSRDGIGGQYDIYKYNLATGQITNLTNHPALDSSMDWISDDVLSVSPKDKKEVLWGKLKQ